MVWEFCACRLLGLCGGVIFGMFSENMCVLFSRNIGIFENLCAFDGHFFAGIGLSTLIFRRVSVYWCNGYVESPVPARWTEWLLFNGVREEEQRQRRSFCGMAWRAYKPVYLDEFYFIRLLVNRMTNHFPEQRRRLSCGELVLCWLLFLSPLPHTSSVYSVRGVKLPFFS